MKGEGLENELWMIIVSFVDVEKGIVMFDDLKVRRSDLLNQKLESPHVSLSKLR